MSERPECLGEDGSPHSPASHRSSRVDLGAPTCTVAGMQFVWAVIAFAVVYPLARALRRRLARK
jgi:hypothetical protein